MSQAPPHAPARKARYLFGKLAGELTLRTKGEHPLHSRGRLEGHYGSSEEREKLERTRAWDEHDLSAFCL